MSAQPRRFLTARWLNLAMLNYEVDPDLLAPHVPSGTVLDRFDGRCFVSMVGFSFAGTRVLGVPIPFHRSFDEVNLRFYVRRETAEGALRGVVFLKEIVPRRATAWLARRLYGENYLALPMKRRDDLGSSWRRSIAYEWLHGGRWHSLALSIDGLPHTPAEGSQESFITEHYRGYTRRPDGSTLEYRVEHPPWRVWRAPQAELDCDVAALYGADFADFVSATPASAFLAEGSPVSVRFPVVLP